MGWNRARLCAWERACSARSRASPCRCSPHRTRAFLRPPRSRVSSRSRNCGSMCGTAAHGQARDHLFTRPSRRAGYVPRVAATTEPGARRAGRPRRSVRPTADSDPRREILAAASHLFAERGVAGTTMAEIARRSGLQQPSLYYYFRSKGQLLDEIVGEANRAPLELVERVRASGGSPAVQLYRIIRADVAALCALPYDLNEIHRLAAEIPKRSPATGRSARTSSGSSPRSSTRASRGGPSHRRSADHRPDPDVERRGHAELASRCWPRRPAGASRQRGTPRGWRVPR